jgi:hypothetical protein
MRSFRDVDPEVDRYSGQGRAAATACRRGQPATGRQGQPSTTSRGRPDDRPAGPGDSDAINRRSPELETEMDAMTLLLRAITILLTLDVAAAQLR